MRESWEVLLLSVLQRFGKHRLIDSLGMGNISIYIFFMLYVFIISLIFSVFFVVDYVVYILVETN